LLTSSQTSAVHGEMAERFRDFDWSSTPLGPVDRWPESWRNAVNIILDSSFPTALGLGSQLIYFYNDAFIPLAGPSRHPHGLGAPVALAWKEIWEQILAPRFAHTLRTGLPTGEVDLLMPLERSGYLEETFITFSFAALRDANSKPNGIFCTAIETTARVIADRQLLCLRALAAQGSLAETPEAACQAAVATLEANPRDLPFALLYLVDRGGKRARLAGTVGLASVPDTVPAIVDLSSSRDPWRFSALAATRAAVSIEGVQPLIAGSLRVTEVTPQHAVALPIASRGDSELAAILVAGANPMRPLEESRTFHTLIAGHLETALSNARAKQFERERAQALAELDRAKTIFFSNVSHELRTPLTLLLAPLDETLARGKLESTDRQSLELARRGGGRLLKLVNSLLEFSRIEAGRIEAAYEPIDLAALTADLASMFRSAFERAGVTLTIECNRLPEAVYVDRDKWEKIVLNLISNALKFTFAGEVSVTQRALADHIQLEIKDSGCGIAAEDLARVFERFFRGRASQTRTHEGSGIGLSLVQELVKFHGGSIIAQSELGHGTTMTVRIPRGCAHLDTDRIIAPRNTTSSRAGLHAFVEEALGWLPDGSFKSSIAEPTPTTSVSESLSPTEQKVPETAASILVVDDNADMRGYLCRLLDQRWRTEGATDGLTALARIRRRPPDLVIADVMMPRLDGFGLIRALRDDPTTAQVPVMLLSARAGEEASAEGLRAGADDYVIKPFSARELIARIESRLTQARLRAAERHGRDAAERANQARDEFFAMLSHELRTPLMAVLGWTALLRGNRLGPQDTEYAVDIIERNARTQRRMVDDLLDVSRIVTGRLQIDARPIPSLAPVIAMVVDSFRPVAHGKGLTVVTALEHDAGPLRADPERLQQVAWNLLSNAIHFTPPGGTIEVRCAREESHVLLHVRDSGRGISPEAVPHIFERYWQGGTHPRRQGLGLGLAITHKIVELHTGSIEAASDGEGRGTLFTVRLPIDLSVHSYETGFAIASADFEPLAAASARILDAATATAERDPDATIGTSPALQVLGMTTPLRSANSDDSEISLRILLVEDHDGIARACQRLLVSHGHLVIRAAGAASAVAAAERERFDLFICDLSLPDGNGVELLPRLRACSQRWVQCNIVPAIAISGSVFEDDIARCLDVGFTAHVAKPFDEERLLAVIAEVTGQIDAPQDDSGSTAVGIGGIRSPVPARLR
jgi:signal transduction histidine kinase